MVPRVQVATAAAIFAVGVVAAVVMFGDRTHRLAGTNSIGNSADVAMLEPGERLCVRDLWLPPDAAAVSLFLGTGRRGPSRVDLVLRTRGRALRSSYRVVKSDGAEAQFPLRAGGRGGPASLCITSRGGLGTVKGTQSDPIRGINYVARLSDLDQRPNATRDGRPLSGLVAVRFHEATATSKLERLGDATRRASLLRAGWIGPWTYVALFAVIPLLWIAGLLTIWRLGR